MERCRTGPATMRFGAKPERKFAIALAQALPIGLREGSPTAGRILSPWAWARQNVSSWGSRIGRKVVNIACRSLDLLAFRGEGPSGPSIVTAMRRASILRNGPFGPQGRGPLHVRAAHAQTSRPARHDSPSGPPDGFVRPGRSGPTCQRRCLSMPPIPRKPGWSWSTETRSKNSTSRP